MNCGGEWVGQWEQGCGGVGDGPLEPEVRRGRAEAMGAKERG
jgi:hypothetical protein